MCTRTHTQIHTFTPLYYIGYCILYSRLHLDLFKSTVAIDSGLKTARVLIFPSILLRVLMNTEYLTMSGKYDTITHSWSSEATA